jgi:hypothetical protein
MFARAARICVPLLGSVAGPSGFGHHTPRNPAIANAFLRASSSTGKQSAPAKTSNSATWCRPQRGSGPAVRHQPTGTSPGVPGAKGTTRTISPLRPCPGANGRVRRRLAVTAAQADACQDGSVALDTLPGCASVSGGPVTAGNSWVGPDWPMGPQFGSRWLPRRVDHGGSALPGYPMAANRA